MYRSASLKRLLIYGLSGPIIALNIWLLSQVFRYFEHLITLLAAAAILGFLLNYPVKFFERAHLSRTQAVIIVLLVTLTLLVILGVTLVPVVIDQTYQLLNNIPDLLASSQQNLEKFEIWAKARRLPLVLRDTSSRLNSNIETLVQQFAGQAVGVAGTLLSGLVDMVLIVVLAFYMLLYGDRLWNGLVNLLPVYLRFPLTSSLRLNFHNFFLSQLLLGLFMVVTLVPIFLILKVPFALLFALVIGIAQLIPLIGASLGIGLVTILVLLQNWWLAIQVALVTILMQQVKDNLLAPKLMGDITGLNPIWIFITILIGIKIAGLLGALVAVPIAGTIKGVFDTLRSASSQMVVSTLTLQQDSPPDDNE